MENPQTLTWPFTNLVAIRSNEWENYAIVIRGTICNICSVDIEASGKKIYQVYDLLYVWVHSHCCLKSHDELFHVRVVFLFVSQPVTWFQDNLQLHTESYSSTNCSSCSHHQSMRYTNATCPWKSMWQTIIMMIVACIYCHVCLLWKHCIGSWLDLWVSI